MIRPKQWLGAILTAAMLAQLAVVTPLPGATASAAADPVAASGLPDSWSAVSMYASEASNPGSVTAAFAENKLTLSAAAGKIDSSGDNAVYAFMPAAGDKDFTFTARISEFTPSPSNAWALLMVKDGSDATSKMVALGLDYNGGNFRVRDYRRLDSTGGGNAVLGPETGPVYVRMQRTGDNLAFAYSTDGGSTYQSRTNYSNNGNNHYTHLNLSTLNIGFAVSAGSAVFDQITFTVDGSTVFDSNAVTDDVNPPGQPDGLIATPRDGAVGLEWNAVAGAAFYQVKGGSNAGGPYNVLLDGVAGTHATIDGLTNGAPYYFVVAAGNANGMGADSEPIAAVPTELTVPGLYELSGFAAYTTGGGVIAEDDPSYRQVTSALELHAALTPGSGVKVVEIMNDLDLGWLEIPEGARSAPFAKHNEPLLHPVLLKTGVTKITIDGANGLTLFSRNGSAIRHASLVFRSSSNIIIRNLRFDELWEWDEATGGDYDRNDWDYISLENGTRGVWIDHATFGKAYDGVVDAKGGSSGITISWSRFEGDEGTPGSWVSEQIEALDRLPAKYPMYSALLDSGLETSEIIAISAGQKKGHLIGASEMAADNAQLELTLHHNLYLDMMDRIPRLRAGNAHVYNIVVDSSRAHAAGKRITPAIAAEIADAGYHFGVTSNGAISTEGGALLLENSAITDVLYPLRNNQKDNLDPLFTGKIKAENVQYSLDGATFTGGSDTPDSPLAPVPAEPIEFAWNTDSGELPYLYEPEAIDGLASLLNGTEGSDAGAGGLYWNASNWLRIGGYEGAYADQPDMAPAAPSGLLAESGDGEVKLRWGKVGSADSYTVYRSESADGPFEEVLASIEAAFYIDEGAVNGVSYTYRVSALNARGESGLSAAIRVTPQPLAAPNVPSDIAASGGSTKIAIMWQPSAGADYYRVYRRPGGSGSFAVLADPVFEAMFEDTTASQGVAYEYAVTAVNAAGESGMSTAALASLTDLTELSELRLLQEDTFNAEGTGSKPQSYTVIEESGTLTVADVPSAADKSLRFFDDRTGVVLADRSFEPQTSIAGASFDFMQESKANSVKVFRLVSEAGIGSTSNSYAAVAIETNGGHLAYRTNGGYVPFLMNYEAGVWYSVGIVANLATGKADIYVNGELALEQIGLFNAVPDISGIQSFTANNNSANVYYLDNVRAYGEKDEDDSGSGSEGGGSGIVVLPRQPVVTTSSNGAVITVPVTRDRASDGTTTYAAHLTPAVLKQAGMVLADSGNRMTIQVEDDGNADEVQVSLPLASLLALLEELQGGSVENEDHGSITLEVRSTLGRYRVSTQTLPLAYLEDSASLEEARLMFTMSRLTDEEAEQLMVEAEESGLTPLSPATDFGLSIVTPSGDIEVNDLEGYAARWIRLPDDGAIDGIAGAVYDPSTGTFSGVPAHIVREGESAFAEIVRTGNSIYVAVTADRAFDDLDGHWAREDVESLANRLFIEGVSPQTFAPDGRVTRAQFAAMLGRSLGLTGGASTFADVPEDAWYASAVSAAERFGLADGFGDGTFRPETFVTREQMASMLHRALQWSARSTLEEHANADGLVDDLTNNDDVESDLNRLTPLGAYADADAVSDWAVAPLAALIEAGILQGTPGGKLLPGQLATRAEAAAMIARLLKFISGE